MVVTFRTPDYADQRYGPHPSHQLDYWRHPTRDSGGNPLLLIRHGGGGIYEDHRYYRDDTIANIQYFLHYANGANTTIPAVHWDICSFTSPQRAHYRFSTEPTASISRYIATFMPDAIRECQRSISLIKGLSSLLGFDPNRVVGLGESYGASLMGLAAMAPPLVASGGRRTWYERAGNRGRPHSSRLCGVVLHLPQVDCRNTAGTANGDYIVGQQFGSWFGIREDTLADGTWTVASKTLTSAFPGKFAGMRAGDTITVTGGTGATTGNYTVASLTDHKNVVLTTNIAAGNLATGDIAARLNHEITAVPTEVREACSLRCYFERGETQFYPGFFHMNTEQGAHVKPYTDPHDSAQFAELNASMTAAGVAYGSMFYSGTLTNAAWPADPTGNTLALYLTMYNWCVSRIKP